MAVTRFCARRLAAGHLFDHQLFIRAAYGGRLVLDHGGDRDPRRRAIIGARHHRRICRPYSARDAPATELCSGGDGGGSAGWPRLICLARSTSSFPSCPRRRASSKHQPRDIPCVTKVLWLLDRPPSRAMTTEVEAAVAGHATVRITRPTFSKISPISSSLTMSGGVSAMVSPGMRMTMFSS